MRNSGGRAVGLWVIGVLLLQAAWIITIPPFRGSDEFDHAFRAAAVARGEWVAGDPAADGRGWLVEVPKSLVDAARGQCEDMSYTGPDNCSPADPDGDGVVLVASSAAGYHPAFYWVIGTAASPFEGAAALYAMRIATAMLCLIFMAAAAWALTRLPTRWPLAALTLSASPVLLYSTTVAAPNGPEMAAALSLWSALLALTKAEGRSRVPLFWVATVSAVVLGTLRLIGPLFILLIVVTVAVLGWRELLNFIRRHPRSTATGVSLVGLSVAGFAWWLYGPLRLEPGGTGREGLNSLRSGDVILWPLQSIAAFPFRNQMGAAIVYPVVVILVGALVVGALRAGTRTHRLVLVGSLLLALLLPFILTLATLDGRGVIWQGRYGLPYSVGFILLSGYVLAGRSSPLVLRWRLTIPAGILYGVAIASCLVKVRHDELANNTASAADASWHPLGPILLAAIVAAAMLCFALCLSGRSREPA